MTSLVNRSTLVRQYKTAYKCVHLNLKGTLLYPIHLEVII